MFVCTLELAKSMNKDALAHQDFEVLLDCLGLSRKVNNHSLPFGTDHSPRQAGCWDHLN